VDDFKYIKITKGWIIMIDMDELLNNGGKLHYSINPVDLLCITDEALKYEKKSWNYNT
jgi:hypothetical protein